MESFGFNIAERVLTKLASHTYQQIGLAWGVKDELNNLKETLQTITIVLLDAEEKQTENRLLSIWLGKLKEVCYDADEVLDDFEILKLQMQVLNHGSIRRKLQGKVCHFLSRSNPLVFRFKMGHRIKEIRERLDKIAIEKANFSLSERVGDWSGMRMQRETGSSVQALDVIGREDDKKLIITYLLKNTSHADVNFSVISIIGIGGLGKTTLAKLVYNDDRLMKEFKFALRMWVCVSNDFDNKTLVRQILKSANENCEDEILDLMEIKLQDVLRDKKFLLVLDDVWDNPPMGITNNKWNRLESLLKVGANGSKLIVTSRSESVALLMNSTHIHPLKGLSQEKCMSLFIKRVFRKGKEKQYSHLMETANSIVQKCGGVPLAVTTVGSLLSSKRNRTDWLKVRDNALWTLEQQTDNILPALKLSYNALPPYLKPCFVFCSLFPKDYEFESPELIALWMAHDFLQTSNGKGYDEIGLDYIKQLCSRSLFQIEKDIIFAMKITMHDLVHDLAISVAGEEFCSVNFRSNNAFERVRHMSLSEKDFSEKEEQVLEFLLQLDKLQTILIPNRGDGMNNETFLRICISKFKYLRVLDLSDSTLEVLPSSIGNLSHLRYLDLSRNSEIKELPDSICELLNLQTLILFGCEELKELPRDIGNLVNLIQLVLTTQQMYLPEGIRHLTSLQFLWVEKCDNLKSLGEGIQYLTNLRYLFIFESKILESLPNMERLTALHTLLISECENLDLMESGQGIRDLRLFAIFNQRLEVLPRWLQDSAKTLEFMCIWQCGYLMVLPEWLQNFRSLQKLIIEDCPKLSSLPEGMHHVTALRELEIFDCNELSKRCKKEEGEDWSKISHVSSILLDKEQIASIEDELRS